MKKIKLTQGKYALIDDEDYDEISKFKWSAYLNRNTYYAHRSVRIENKNKTIKMHRQIMIVNK